MINFNKMRKTAIVGMLLATAPSALMASEIDTIDIRVVLDRSGDAYVQERWKVDVDNSNTEWYLSMKNFGNMVISDFKVFDNDQKYYFSDDTPWDVDRSRDEKAGKCGVHNLEGNDCELCWGVGSSGPHCWTAEYKINGFVKRFEDGCGFNHCFVNHDMSSGPKYTRTTISMADSTPLSAENARIWAFRYNGTCKFVDGKVVAENIEPLTTDNSMVVMCLFPKDAFLSSNVVNDTIGTMKWRALEGSDYLENYTEEDYANGNNVLWKNNEDQDLTFWEIILLIVIFVVGALFCAIGYGLFYLLVAAVLYYGCGLLWNVVSLRPLRIYLRRKKLMEGAQSEYFRAVPLNGNLNRAFHILDENNYKILPKDKDDLYAAYLVRLMCYKAISITSTVEKGKTVNRMKIASDVDWNNVKDENKADLKCMKLMYRILKNASRENLILEKGELRTYLNKNKSDAKSLLKAVEKENKSKCTPQEYQEVVGLKNYLNDFLELSRRGVKDVKPLDESGERASESILPVENGYQKDYSYSDNGDKSLLAENIDKEDNSIPEIENSSVPANYHKDTTRVDASDAKEKRIFDEYEMKMWDEYIVFATLFGMADQVIEDLKEYCPDYFAVSLLGSQLIDESGHVVSDFNSYTGISSVSHSFSSHSSSSSSGRGGHSSFGGGGGHSGGGGGGGGR